MNEWDILLSTSLETGNEKIFTGIIIVGLIVIAAMISYAVLSLKKQDRLENEFDNDINLDVDYDNLDMIGKEQHECIKNETAITEESEAVISVDNVSMIFRINNEESSGLKDYIIRAIKGKNQYRMLKALNKVNFEIYEGEVVGIIGTNGSGKSTLLKIISGALLPTFGNVFVDHDKVQLLTLGTGFDVELTGRENVYLNGAIIGYTKEYIDSKYDEIVEFAQLDGFMDEKIKNYSSGMVSRLAFAIATAGNASEILVLDEVLSVGDMFFRKKSEKRIRELITSGSTVLIVSHSMEVIMKNCTKVIWLEKGVVRQIGEPKAVCEAYKNMSQGA